MTLIAAPPPLMSHQVLVYLLQILLLLALARILGRLAERCTLPAVVGELLAGVLLGPSVLQHLVPGVAAALLPGEPGQIVLLDAVAQLGLLLLVGVAGAHLDWQALRRRRATALRISVSGLLVPLGLGVGVAFVLPGAVVTAGTDRRVFALFLGVAMCVSAIPVIAKTLADMRLLHRDVGQLTLAAGMVDDAAGWLLLSLVTAAATIGISVGSTALAVLSIVGFMLAAALLGGPVVRWLLRLGGRSAEPGPTVALAVLVVLAGAASASALGLEPVFGAFVAGILVGTARPIDLARLAPLRTVVLSVLAPLFLATAGLRMDLTALRDPRIALAGAIVLVIAIVGKLAGAYLGARLSRLSNWEALAIGAGMNARGVIEVIVATVGLRLGVLNTATYTLIVLVAVVTSVMAPPLLRLATARIAQTDEEKVRKALHDGLSHVPSTTADRV